MKKLLLSAVAVLGLLPSLTATASAGTTVYTAEDRTNWKISGCSQQPADAAQDTDGDLTRVLDGNISTYWHSCWGISHSAQNHYFVVDRGAELANTQLAAIGYTPRQSATNGNGYVTACDIYILDSIEGLITMGGSDDGSLGVANGGHESLTTFVNGKTPTARGTFNYTYNNANNRGESRVTFEPTVGRYILFVATNTSGDQGNNFANCAEFNAYTARALSDAETLSVQQTAVESLIYKIQTYYGLVQSGSNYSSNKLCATEGNDLNALLDGVYETYMHTEYNGVGENKHYLQANIGNAAGDFRFFTKKRSQNNNNRPSDITIQGATTADGEYTEVATITEGLPSDASKQTYLSEVISGGENTSLRFVVNHTHSNPNDAVPFFTYSEFYILPNNEHVAKAAEIYGILSTVAETEYEAIAAEAAKIAELDAEVQSLIEAASTGVTYTFPALNGETFTLTVDGVMFGTDAMSVLPLPDFFTNAAIAGNTVVSAANNKFTVSGDWSSMPFVPNQAYRIDIRKKESNNCSNLFYNKSTAEVETRNGTNANAFVGERLFYLDAKGLDSATGKLIVTLHSIAADASLGFQVSADNNATGNFSNTPTEFLVVTNSTGADGVTLQHTGNANSHVNDITGTLGIWSNGTSSKNDGGSFLRFFAISDDLEVAYNDYKNATAIQAYENPTIDNVRALCYYFDALTVIDNGDNFASLNIATAEGKDAWTAACGALISDEEVFPIENYNAIVTAYEALVATSANTAGNVYVTFEHPQVAEDMMCVRYDNGAFVGRYGNDVNENKITWQIVAAEGGFNLYSVYSAKYLKMPTADNQNSTLVDQANASVFVFDVFDAEEALYGVKYAETDVESEREYLHSNSGHTVVRWKKDRNSSWYLAAATAETAATENVQGATDELADAIANCVVDTETNVGEEWGYYTISQNYLDAKAAAEAAVEGEDTDAKRAAAAALFAAYPTARVVNGPVAGDFVRFSHYYNGDETLYFIQGKASNVAGKQNTLLVSEDDGAESIFYFDGSSLLSYSAGTYINEDGTTRGMMAVGAAGGNVTFSGGSVLGTFAVQAPSYLHANSTTVDNDVTRYIDHCGDPEEDGTHDFYIDIVGTLPLTIGENLYAAFAAPVALTIPETVQVYQAHQVNNGGLEIYKITGTIPANTPVIVEAETEGTYEFEIAEVEAVALAEEAATSVLTTTTAAIVLPEGAYTLQMKEGKVGMYPAEANAVVSGFSAYMPAEVATSEAGYEFVVVNDPTGIEEIVVESEKVRGIYDLQGRRLSAPVKGINIINGKKVLVK